MNYKEAATPLDTGLSWTSLILPDGYHKFAAGKRNRPDKPHNRYWS
jgi:hypothetical protein